MNRVTKTFDTLDGPLPVLEGVSLQVRAGEIVALLGKSGSGKSTLLRCVAGLVAPSAGTVSFRGRRVTGPNAGTAMVFQTFALLPWLTVRQNVELGLEARDVEPTERAERAERAIDLIGLDGFESAYPKELSGGMRQRVGFARALVVEPEVLLMDEPFSALDVLTAENLRGELLELWDNEDFPIEAIVLVTHNIEEAVILADRIIVLGSNPGRIRAELPVVLPRPRDRNAPEFVGLVEEIYAIMTGRTASELPVLAPADERRTPATVPLPHASVDSLSGLAEILAGLGPISVAELADELYLEVDDLLPLVDALELLDFAVVEAGTIRLTPEGSRSPAPTSKPRNRSSPTRRSTRAPLIRVIVNGLERGGDHTLLAGFFMQVLRRSFPEPEAKQQLDVALDWGRYAELFSYDAAHDELALDPGRAAASTES